MGGRRAQSEGRHARRTQAPKQGRPFGRGHGAHHRHQPGVGAPVRFASGRDRGGEIPREKDFTRLADDTLHDLTNVEHTAGVRRRLEELASADDFGTALEGRAALGLVVEVRRGNFLTRVLTPDSGSPPDWQPGDVLRSFARGTMQQFDLGLSSLVAPGDAVELVIPELAGAHALLQTERHAVLTKVQPRRNEFRRLHPSGRAVQTLAANVDRIFIVASAAEPDFRPGFVDRVLVCAAASSIPVSLVVNKMDLGLKPEDEELLGVYAGFGIPIYRVSARERERTAADLGALAAALAGARSVLSGHSGVGKSSLLLALDARLLDVDVRTAAVSVQSGKGVHTTTHARLFSLEVQGRQAELIDTPGVREFTPADTDRRNLWGWFPEIAALQGQCGFDSCTHTVEQGCAVLAAVEAGRIHPRRHQSYVRIYETLPT